MKKVIRIDNKQNCFDYMECIICNSNQDVKKVVIGSINHKIESTYTFKLCKNCMTLLRSVINNDLNN